MRGDGIRRDLEQSFIVAQSETLLCWRRTVALVVAVTHLQSGLISRTLTLSSRGPGLHLRTHSCMEVPTYIPFAVVYDLSIRLLSLQ